MVMSVSAAAATVPLTSAASDYRDSGLVHRPVCDSHGHLRGLQRERQIDASVESTSGRGQRSGKSPRQAMPSRFASVFGTAGADG